MDGRAILPMEGGASLEAVAVKTTGSTSGPVDWV